MIAVIDIGSNSVRLLLQYSRHKKKFSEITQLSEGLGLTGILKLPAIKRTVKAIVRFCRIAKKQSACDILLFATEAVRSAENGNEFAAAVKLATGLIVDVVSGETEARLGYLGAGGSGLCGIIDVGGASTEVTVGENKNIIYSESCPAGTVRLTDMFGQNELDVKEYLSGKLRFQNQQNCQVFKAIGGTAATLAAINCKLKKFSGEIVDGHILTVSKITDIKNMLYALPVNKRKVTGLTPARRAVTPAGCMILIEVMRLLNVDKICVSDADNLEGYIKYKLEAY